MPRGTRPRDEDPFASLIERIAGGDQRAVAELYDASRTLVFGLAVRIVGDVSSAEDVVIEVYAQVWRQAHSFDPQRGTSTAWLFNIARSRAVDLQRARRRRIEMAAQEPEERCADPDQRGPAAELLDAERRRLVHDAMDALSAAQRQAIELAFFGDLSHSEIAEKLGQPLGTVKTRIRDGMTRLRERLSGSMEPPGRQRA